LKTTGQWIIYYAIWPATVATRPTIVYHHGTPTIVYPGMYSIYRGASPSLLLSLQLMPNAVSCWLSRSKSNYVYAAL